MTFQVYSLLLLLENNLAMDAISKFYSSVQTTVSQLSAVLPGNNVTKEYEITTQVARAGVGMHWKIYNGFKKTTKQEVSVFVFEKKKIEKWSKEDKELYLNMLRRGIQQLTKIKHPRILTVKHPLEESKDTLAFASEPILASLSDILDDSFHSTKLFDVEIICGYQQLMDGLIFLHSDVNLVHGNLVPESIVINKCRSWKIFGLDFADRKGTEFNLSKRGYMKNPLLQPSLNYLAPEKITNAINIPENDVYSLGMLIYRTYCGQPLMEFENNINSFTKFSYPSHFNNQDVYKIPKNVRSILKSMLHPNPHCRPELNGLIQSVTFQDVGVRTLQYLDTLYQYNNLQKSKFYKSLLKIIPDFPHQVNVCTVIPHLVEEFINLPMVPFVLPNILLIAKVGTKQEYLDYILPHLKSIFTIEEPVQVLLIFMQNMNILLKLTPSDDIQVHILPLIYRSLECELLELQDLCLEALPSLAPLIRDVSLKTSVMPRIKKLCIKSIDIAIKVKCLICIGKLLKNLDKWILLSDILPFLEQIRIREPPIIMAIVGVYKIALADPRLGITSDVMGNKCIPFLVPLCMENNLTVSQFTSLMKIVKEMFDRVEREQRAKLETFAAANNANRDHTQLHFTSSNEEINKKEDAQRPTLKTDNTNVVKGQSQTNPLVLNKQLTTNSFDLTSGLTNEECSSINIPINYVYPMQYGIVDHKKPQNPNPFNVDNHTTNQVSNLVSLSQQDIINFLK